LHNLEIAWSDPEVQGLLFNGLEVGNPEEKFRVGNEGLRYCLEAEYGLEPSVVDSILRELVSSGEADVSIEAVAA
jgi:hypothetical protein